MRLPLVFHGLLLPCELHFWFAVTRKAASCSVCGKVTLADVLWSALHAGLSHDNHPVRWSSYPQFTEEDLETQRRGSVSNCPAAAALVALSLV